MHDKESMGISNMGSEKVNEQTEFDRFLNEFSKTVGMLQENRSQIGEKVRAIKNLTTPMPMNDIDKTPDPSGALEQAWYILGILKSEVIVLEEIKSQLCRIV